MAWHGGVGRPCPGPPAKEAVHMCAASGGLSACQLDVVRSPRTQLGDPDTEVSQMLFQSYCCRARSPLGSGTAQEPSLCCLDAGGDYTSKCKAHAHVCKSGHSVPTHTPGTCSAQHTVSGVSCGPCHSALSCTKCCRACCMSGAEHFNINSLWSMSRTAVSWLALRD